jgi:hypothetical protein
MQRSAAEHPRSLSRYRCALALAKARGVHGGTSAVNHFRKQRRIGGCRHSRCWLCHGDKLARRPTVTARRQAATFIEALRSLDTLARDR